MSVQAIVRCTLFAGACLCCAAPLSAQQDVSAAERALFVDKHLDALRPPVTLHYDYRKTGSLEAPFDDSVDVLLAALPGGGCCSASAQFLHGERAVRPPVIDDVQGNPAILYFLERDIREMQRLAKGQANHFRQRIRLALAQSAVIRDIKLPYHGSEVAVREISIKPYLNAPHRARYEKLANKQYIFMLSSQVPGGLYGIRTRIAGDSAQAPPLMIEEMMLSDAEKASVRRQSAPVTEPK